MDTESCTRNFDTESCIGKHVAPTKEIRNEQEFLSDLETYWSAYMFDTDPKTQNQYIYCWWRAQTLKSNVSLKNHKERLVHATYEWKMFTEDQRSMFLECAMKDWVDVTINARY